MHKSKALWEFWPTDPLKSLVNGAKQVQLLGLLVHDALKSQTSHPHPHTVLYCAVLYVSEMLRKVSGCFSSAAMLCLTKRVTYLFASADKFICYFCAVWVVGTAILPNLPSHLHTHNLVAIPIPHCVFEPWRVSLGSLHMKHAEEYAILPILPHPTERVQYSTKLCRCKKRALSPMKACVFFSL